MKFIQQKIKGVYLIKLEEKKDIRGSFYRLFCKKKLILKKLNSNFVQISNSCNLKKGTIRGMHYQKKPFQEDKIISCIKGSIYDVLIDIRPKSRTYLKWLGFTLSENDKKMLYIPKGIAHGFQTLKNDTIINYMMSAFYNKKYSRGIRYDDKSIQVKWPLKCSLISKQDKNWPEL